jgi:hypothetical protein
MTMCRVVRTFSFSPPEFGKQTGKYHGMRPSRQLSAGDADAILGEEETANMTANATQIHRFPILRQVSAFFSARRTPA